VGIRHASPPPHAAQANGSTFSSAPSIARAYHSTWLHPSHTSSSNQPLATGSLAFHESATFHHATGAGRCNETASAFSLPSPEYSGTLRMCQNTAPPQRGQASSLRI